MSSKNLSSKEVNSENALSSRTDGTNLTKYSDTLSDRDATRIRESCIIPKVAAARGYTTIPNTQEGRDRLRELGFAKSQILLPALHLPHHDVDGTVRPGQIRPEIPRTDGRKRKPIKYESPANHSPVVDVPPLARAYLDDPTVDLYVTEGTFKADSGISNNIKCIVSIAGVNCWRGKRESGGIVALPCFDRIALNGRKVFLVFDSDVTRKAEVQRALATLKAFLESRRSQVFIIYLPDGPNGEKTGLDDYFARGGTVEGLALHTSEVLRQSDKAQKKVEKNRQKVADLESTGVPVIETNDRQSDDELQDLSRAIERHNSVSPTIFHGPGGLATIERDKDGEPFLQGITLETMQVIAGKAARWISTSEREGVRNVAPPRDLCSNFLKARSDWRGIPPIDRIVKAPFVDRNGVICSTPGYYPSARVFLSLPAGFQLLDTTPTAENVQAAKSLLLNTLLGEVAFADEASRANALAVMILPTLHHLIDDDTPLHLFDAPVQSSGKTYTAKICIAPYSEAIPTPEIKNDEENRKQLFAILSGGADIVFIDNVRGDMSGSTMATAITSGKMEGRIIGTGQMGRVSTRVTWVATSNNAQLARDSVSRCVLIRLDTNEENPEGREYNSNPLQYIAQHRGAVLTAVLTLVRHWQAQGSPEYSGKCRSRFKRWEKVIGGILEANGVPGFLDNIDAARDSLDPETEAWRAFVAMWHRQYGTTYLTAAELLPMALKCEELAAIIGDREGQAARFGKILSTKRDKIFAELKIIRSNEKSNKGAKWRVSPLASMSSCETAVKTALETAPESDVSDISDEKLYPTRNTEKQSMYAKEYLEIGFPEVFPGVVTMGTTATAGRQRLVI